MAHNSPNAVSLTFTSLRERAFSARAKLSGASSFMVVGFAELTFVAVASLVQIAQDLNEIKFILADTRTVIKRTTDNG